MCGPCSSLLLVRVLAAAALVAARSPCPRPAAEHGTPPSEPSVADRRRGAAGLAGAGRAARGEPDQPARAAACGASTGAAGPGVAAVHAGEGRDPRARSRRSPSARAPSGTASSSPTARVRSTVTDYVASSQAGNPETLAQMAVFRMVPWEGEACKRRDDAGRGRELPHLDPGARRRHRQRAHAGGDAARRPVPALRPGPRGEVRAADLGHPDAQRPAEHQRLHRRRRGRLVPERHRAGVVPVRGDPGARAASSTPAASRSTPPTTPARSRTSTAAWRSSPSCRPTATATQHFIVDTAKSGRPTLWRDMVSATPKGLRNNARTCTTRAMKRCVTLGIPPTPRPADPQWGLPERAAPMAAQYVDGFVWFGRPWLFNQADPFVTSRALDMARSTPWTATGPR